MRKLLSNGLVVFAGVVSLPIPGTHADSGKPVAAEYRSDTGRDPRLLFLRSFFEETHSPAAKFSYAFLEAADTYALDWRLLPSISFVESAGGKVARNNNLLGWGSGRAEFSSAIACIRTVASALAHSALYRKKDLDGILNTYNPNADYAGRVKSVMRRIAPSQNVD